MVLGQVVFVVRVGCRSYNKATFLPFTSIETDFEPIDRGTKAWRIARIFLIMITLS